MSRFTSQPSSRNCTASQSSSSGWLGGSPCEPKSSAVLTMPVPKNCCQNRLTATRAVSGCFGAISHWARPRRFIGAPGGSGGRNAGVARLDLVAPLVVLAAVEHERRLAARRPSRGRPASSGSARRAASALARPARASRAAARTTWRVLAYAVLDEVGAAAPSSAPRSASPGRASTIALTVLGQARAAVGLAGPGSRP